MNGNMFLIYLNDFGLYMMAFLMGSDSGIIHSCHEPVGYFLISPV